MKRRIAVVTGGNSSEYIISIQSAEQVVQKLDRDLYEVYVINIRGTDWELTNDNYCGVIIDKNDFSFRFNNQKFTFDAVFLALHGTPGEDGMLQGYFDLLKIPYTSSSMQTAALTFNKYNCNAFLRNEGVLVADSVRILKRNTYNTDAIVDRVGLPCFVKPNNGGSSCGASKVSTREGMQPAIDKAFAEDPEVIIEAYIAGRELTCGVMKTADEEIVFPVTEIISNHEFFDFEAKYNTETMADEVVPADLPENITKQCKTISAKVYDLLNCNGIVRADYILKGNQMYFLEVNTIPGMTLNSLVPKQIRAAGLTETAVYTKLIEDAIKRVVK